jgi:aspartate/methionine/tyrosine aminotransferase
MEFGTKIDFNDTCFLMFVLDRMAYDYEKDNKDVIRMTLGKSELPLHPSIRSAMHEALDDLVKSSYVFPAGLPELKNRLSAFYQDKYRRSIDPENFIISAGTSAIFRNLFQLLVKAGDEILLPLPYYPLYQVSALLAQGKIRYYRIDPDTLRVDIKSFKENFTGKTKVVVINSPGNPFGNILTHDELYTLDSVVNGRAVIVSDEIYANMSFDGPAVSALQLDEPRSVFVVTDSFSKGYRMYSRRVGYCIVPDELIAPLTVIQQHTLLTVDPVVQYGAAAALAYQQEVDCLRQLYRSRRDYTLEKFKEAPDIKALESAGGFYITLDCAAFMKKNKFLTSLGLAVKIMERACVATVPGSDFGIPHTLRLSYTTARFKEGVDLLVNFFSTYKA